MAGVMGIRKFAREQQPGKITERVYPPSPALVQLNDLSMSGFDPVMDLPRVIEMAREVEQPRVAPVAAASSASPVAAVARQPREVVVPVRAEKSLEDIAREKWEDYNRSGLAADFVRADEALMRARQPAKDGGMVDHAMRVARQYGGQSPAYMDPMGGMMQTGDAEAPAPEWYERTADIAEKAGRTVGAPMQAAAEDYLRNVGKAFEESRGMITQSGRDITGAQGPLPQVGAPINYGLGVLGMGFSPLTGAAMSAGHAATQMTGDPRFGQKVELLGGVIDPSHVGMLTKGAMAMSPAVRAVQLAREAQAPARELTPLGFYSHGYEMASALPQAKGTPEQFYSTLSNPKFGVKEAELEGFREAFAGRPSMTREEAAEYFRGRLPQIEETVLGVDAKPPIPESRYRELASAWENRQLTPEEMRDFNAYERYVNGERLPSDTKFIPTRYSEYTLPGGENYREVLLKSPEKKNAPIESNKSAARMLFERNMMEKYGGDSFPSVYNRLNPNEIDKYEMLSREDRNSAQTALILEHRRNNYVSSHWPNQPNVIAHMRMSDRVGPQGEKVLHLEELQSDWAQAGRKVGFSDPASKAAAKEKMDQLSTRYDELGRERRLAEKEMAELPDYNDRFEQLQNRVSQIGQERDLLSDQMASLRSTIKGDAIPPGPYVTKTEDWTNLALKRALREAAEGGYERLVWTPGAEQAKRYSLGNQVRSIDYMKEGPDTYRLGIVDKRGEGIDLPKETFTAKELEDYLGRDVAAKIVNDEGRSYRGRNHKSIEGVDLVLGGEGMKGYYDKIVPTALQKLTKKLDPSVKVGKSEVAGIEVPSIEITPKMREEILKGLPAYASGGSVADNAIQLAKRIAKKSANIKEPA